MTGAGRRKRILMVLGVLSCAASVAVVAGYSPAMFRPAAPPESGGGGSRGGNRRVTAGEYRSPVDTVPGARSRGLAAAAADEARPAFAGEIAGLFLSSDAGDLPARYGRPPCAQDRLGWISGARVEGHPDFPGTVRYLPPGAEEQGLPQAVACDSGEIVLFQRRFELRPGGQIVEIVRSSLRAVPIARASAARVRRGEVAGRPAAFVEPLTPEGFGVSGVLVPLGGGALRVTAEDVPFDEVLRIAEGVIPSCDDC